MALIACKSRHRLHSQLDGTVSHEHSGAANRESCWINPEDARVRGIREGDIVLLKNRRGRAMASALVTERIMPGVVVLHHGAWFDSAQTREGPLDLRGNSNTLTMDEPASSLSCGNIASSALVEVQKWEGPLPPVGVFEEPPAQNS